MPPEIEAIKHIGDIIDGEWENVVKEAVIATYPEDIFPKPEYKPKNNEVAWVMREMSGAIVSILKPIVEDIVSSRDTYWKERVEEIIKMADTLELECGKDGDKGTKQWMAFKGFRNTIRDRFLTNEDNLK